MVSERADPSPPEPRDAQYPRVILLPGLGADRRMFHRQVGHVPGLITPAWIPHRRDESLRDYARRMAGTILEREHLTQPILLGGVSMGGMVALEMACLLPCRGVVLIGSCRHPSAVSRPLRLSELASRLAPSIFLDKGRLLAPLFLGRGGTINAQDRALLCRMACELPVDFLRWAARAIVRWDGCEDPGVPVRAIHGRRDWVIPLSRVNADRVIERGIHVLNLSHAAEVNQFVIACAAIGEKPPANREQ